MRGPPAESGTDTEVSLSRGGNLKGVEIYTEKAYIDYGWARANNVLSKQENESWKAKLQYKNQPKAHSGARIIEVSNKSGIANVLVYTKGTYLNPVIEKVVRINEDIYVPYDVETLLSMVRSIIYEEEKVSRNACEIVGSRFEQGYIVERVRGDVAGYQEYARRREGEGRGADSSRTQSDLMDGKRTSDVRFSLSLKANFENLFTVSDNGIVKPNNVEDLSTEDWAMIARAVKRIGYDIPNEKTAKEVYSRYVGKSGFNHEQSAAIMEAYGETERKKRTFTAPDERLGFSAQCHGIKGLRHRFWLIGRKPRWCSLPCTESAKPSLLSECDPTGASF